MKPSLLATLGLWFAIAVSSDGAYGNGYSDTRSGAIANALYYCNKYAVYSCTVTDVWYESN